MCPHPREKIGRNDPCPCGSGKKFKHCCLAKQALSEDSRWQRQHDISGQLTADLMRFAEREFPDDMFDAWCDFNQEDFPPDPERVPDEDTIFMPYYLFLWNPERPARGRRPGEVGMIASAYELRRKDRLSSLEFEVLLQATTQPLSFYEVLWSKPGERMALRDVLIGGQVEVIEHMASRGVMEGELLYGQVWVIDGLPVLGCSAPFRIPAKWIAEVIALRAKLRKKVAKRKRELGAADLIRYEEDVRLAYLYIRDCLHTPPTLQNTDGELVAFHTLTFQAGSAAVAFDALAPLAWGLTKEDLLTNAKFDADGALQSVTFDWIKKGNRKIKSWENTILGTIRISGQSLVAEANSAQRAQRLHKEIVKRLGILAVHKDTKVLTPQELLNSAPEEAGPDERKAKKEDEDILRDPAARKHFQEMLQRQVEDWVHEKVPLLGGKTPLQAVQTPDGKEIVEALLSNWERDIKLGAFPAGIRPDINAVRRLLNLTTTTH